MGNTFNCFDSEVMYGELKIKFDNVCEENDRLRAALEMVEWLDLGFYTYCPWCKGDYDNHKPDCLRQLALGIEVK